MLGVLKRKRVHVLWERDDPFGVRDISFSNLIEIYKLGSNKLVNFVFFCITMKTTLNVCSQRPII